MRAACDEPEEFPDYCTQEYALGGEERKEEFRRMGGVGGGAREGEFHLWWKRDGVGACACAVGTVLAIGKDIAYEVEVLVFFVRGVCG